MGGEAFWRDTQNTGSQVGRAVDRDPQVAGISKTSQTHGRGWPKSNIHDYSIIEEMDHRAPQGNRYSEKPYSTFYALVLYKWLLIAASCDRWGNSRYGLGCMQAK